MKQLILLFLIIFNFSFSKQTIILATDSFPPFSTPDLKDNGFFAEIVKEAFLAVDYNLKIEFVPWARAMELGAKGTYDGIIGALYNKDREKMFFYSDPVYKYGLVMFTRKEFASTKIELDKIKKVKLGQVRSYYYPIDKTRLADYTIIETSSIENNLKSLIHKRVDIIIESSPVIEDLLARNFSDYSDDIVPIEILEKSNFYIMLSKKIKNYEKITEEFNKGLKEIKMNGTYDKILKKHGISKI